MVSPYTAYILANLIFAPVNLSSKHYGFPLRHCGTKRVPSFTRASQKFSPVFGPRNLPLPLRFPLSPTCRTGCVRAGLCQPVARVLPEGPNGDSYSLERSATIYRIVVYLHCLVRETTLIKNSFASIGRTQRFVVDTSTFNY